MPSFCQCYSNYSIVVYFVISLVLEVSHGSDSFISFFEFLRIPQFLVASDSFLSCGSFRLLH